jgi:phosphoglycerate dehydrogenase-like enzyme
MRILSVTRSGKSGSPLAEQSFPVSRLEDALAQADYVVLAAPETPETKSLMGAKQFARMKRTAVFINVARGSLLDEEALIAALETGQIAGAALDVAAIEPLPRENPLWTTKNLFLTPHSSAVSEALWPRQTAMFMELLERWFAGKDLFNVVDFSRGY